MHTSTVLATVAGRWLAADRIRCQTFPHERGTRPVQGGASRMWRKPTSGGPTRQAVLQGASCLRLRATHRPK